ncbi:MAG: hypothetical protein IT370_06010 [Deltaproteobacteria bacterium]|nr:hypothetical protein [Deltaproteobacteria bacterium]
MKRCGTLARVVVGVAGLAAAVLGGACAGPEDGRGGSGAISFSISALQAADIGALRLTVLGSDATCGSSGDVTGTALTGLADLELAVGVARTVKVPAGLRTFSVLALDRASVPLARGCAQRTLGSGETATVDITMHDITAGGDGGLPDGGLPDGEVPDADVVDGDLPDGSGSGNDLCSMAATLSAGTPAIGSADGAGSELATSCGGAAPDVFFRITIPAGGARSLTAQVTSSFNTALTLLRADCSTEVVCAGAATAMGDSIDIGNLAPGDYFLAVEAIQSAGGGSGNFVVSYALGVPRPVNDQCSASVPLLTSGVSASGTVKDGRDDATGTCGVAGQSDVAYRFVVPAGVNQRATVVVSNAVGFDPVLFVRSATCTGAQQDCSQYEGGGSETLDLTDLAPGTYFVWVDAAAAVSGAGTFDLRVTLSPRLARPANDLCTAATLLAPATNVTGSTVGASSDRKPLCATPFDSKDTVHRIDTTAGGAQAVLVSVTPTTPASWPVVATLDDAVCPATMELSCSNAGFDTRYINRPNLPGGSYNIYVDGVAGASGDYSVRYDTRPQDLTFGYWRIDTTGTYVPLTGGTMVPGFVTGLAASDELSWPVNLPFGFDFYGTTHNLINISANMYLTFGTVPADANSYQNDCPLNATAPNDTIALFWDDAYAPSTAPVAELQTKTEGSAPNRRFIIEYKNWDFIWLQGPGNPNPQNARVTQQVILYENGDIEMRYGPRRAGVTQDCGANRHLGCGATIGLENAAGTDIDDAQCNLATVNDGKVIYWVHPR